jgi:hypothetical protein
MEISKILMVEREERVLRVSILENPPGKFRKDHGR